MIRFDQGCLAVCVRDNTVKTGCATSVAATAVAADFHKEQQAVLIAINAHILQVLDLSRCSAFVPERLARARPIPDLARIEGFL